MTSTSTPPPSPPPSAPSRSPLSQRVYAVERRFAAAATGLIGAVVFLDVVHRTASREEGLLGRFLGPGPWTGALGTVLGIAFFTVVVQAALRMRGRAPSAQTWGLAAAVAVAGWLALRAFLWLLPNGLVWSQTLGLVLMLWVGVVGASMATYEHRHLALDLGSKLWPKSVLPKVQAVGHLITALFCFVLVVLAVVSLRDHHRDWVDTDGAGGSFVAIALPKFVAFAVVPVGFLLMGVRFMAQMREAFGGVVEEDDALHMLGLQADAHDPSHPHVPGEEDAL
jgi:TRAP-type C4-dicarboxylate transport system permease small subunit